MSIPWGEIINAGAQVASSYVANKARGRQAEAGVNQAQDRNALAGYQTDASKDIALANAEAQAKLDRALGMLKEYEAALSAPGARAGNSVRGDVLANVQDATVSAPAGVNVTSFGGGLRPSLLSGNSRELGRQMSREALLSQMEGTPTPYTDLELPDFDAIRARTAPELTGLPQPSGFDRVMEGIGTYGSMAAAVQQAMQQRNQQPTTAATLALTPPGSRATPGLPPGVGVAPPNQPWVPPPTNTDWRI